MSESKKKKSKGTKKKSASTTSVVESTGGVRDYLRQSSELRTGLIMVLPLFVLYQLGVLFTGGVRNGVDFVTSAMWWVVQGNMAGYLGLNALILLVFGGLVFFGLRGKSLMSPKLWPVVLAESTVYAMFFGTAVIQLMSVFGLDATLAHERDLPANEAQRFGYGRDMKHVSRWHGTSLLMNCRRRETPWNPTIPRDDTSRAGASMRQKLPVVRTMNALDEHCKKSEHP